jgi:D-glucosaminate-6-phosphate ammonia-lyase
LPLAEVTSVALAAGLPVIVDAAAQLPPKSNLWHYTKELGATAAIFSGGKEIGGPQASGFIVGESNFMDWCRLAGPPSPNLLRALKTGKEEMCGLVRAIELYIARDEDAHIAALEATVQMWNETLSRIPRVTATRVFPNIDGQPTPRSRVNLEGHVLGAADVAKAMLAGNPSISVMVDGEGLLLAADPLEPGEAEIVLDRLCEVLK